LEIRRRRRQENFEVFDHVFFDFPWCFLCLEAREKDQHQELVKDQREGPALGACKDHQHQGFAKDQREGQALGAC
jgi:hypothetical protein